MDSSRRAAAVFDQSRRAGLFLHRDPILLVATRSILE
jgi:hypothetical protein